jgi:hypothetical protein
MNNTKEILRDLNEAFVTNDSDYILQFVTDDVRWKIIGDQVIVGKENFEEVVKEMETDEAFELRINNIIVHDSKAVVDGSIKSKSAIGEENTYFFCDIYQLADSEDFQISEITSFVVEESPKAKSVKT